MFELSKYYSCKVNLVKDIKTDQYSHGNLLAIIDLSQLSRSFYERYVIILALTIALPIIDFQVSQLALY